MENVTQDMNGLKVRCAVTDFYLNTIVSDEAGLTVAGVPRTGDDANLQLYIAAVLAGAALLWWIWRRKKKM